VFAVAYDPQPIDTSRVRLAEDLDQLTERLAENAHEIWARRRLAEGWTLGPERDDARMEHPCLVPYDQLPDSEKQYDRDVAMESLKAIVALGYRIEKVGPPRPGPTR